MQIFSFLSDIRKYRFKSFPLGPFFIFAYITLASLINGIDLVKIYFFQKDFKNYMRKNVIEGNFQRQKNELEKFLERPLQMIERFDWAIQSSVKLHDESMFLQIVSSMKSSPSVEMVSIILRDNNTLEVSRIKDFKKDNNSPTQEAYRCVSSEKKEKTSLLKNIVYSSSGQKLVDNIFDISQNLSSLKNNFSLFSSYDDLSRFSWLDEVKKAGHPMWLPPSEILGANKGLYVSLASPLYDMQEGFMGVIMAHVPLDQIVKLTKDLCFEHELVGIFDSTGHVIALSRPRLFFDSNSAKSEFPPHIKDLSSSSFPTAYSLYIKDGSPNKILLPPYSKNYKETAYFYSLPHKLRTDWTLINLIKERNSHHTHFILFSLKVILLVSFLAAFLIFIAARLMVRPLKVLSQHFTELAQFKVPNPLRLSSSFQEIRDMISACHMLDQKLGAFYRLIPLSISKFFISQGKEIEISATKVQATQFFCDMAGFTHLAEFMPPENLLHHLSSYFEAFTLLIQHHQGLVEQYIGDAISAVWGAPLPISNHEELACQCALQCLSELDTKLNPYLIHQGSPTMYITFGLSSDHVLVGNIGSYDHMQYTVTGENASMAQAIQELNRHYGTRILVNETIYQKAGHLFAMRPVDKVLIDGRPWMVYELMADFKSNLNQDLTATCYQVVQTHQAWSFYQKKQWDKAHALYEHILAKFPDDKLALVMKNRCQTFTKNPPPSQWEGACNWAAPLSFSEVKS